VAEATGDGEPEGDAVGNGGSSLDDETIGVGDVTAVGDGAEIGEATGTGEAIGSAASAVSSDPHHIDANKERDRALAIRGSQGRPGTMCPL
jgi:hypothetical protein